MRSAVFVSIAGELIISYIFFAIHNVICQQDINISSIFRVESLKNKGVKIFDLS
jgi:hypothetical protein